jgi:hypothetical protein
MNQYVAFGMWVLVTVVEMLMGRLKYAEMSLSRTSSLSVAHSRIGHCFRSSSDR